MGFLSVNDGTIDNCVEFAEEALDALGEVFDETPIPIVSLLFKVGNKGRQAIETEEKTEYREFKKNIRDEINKLKKENPTYKKTIGTIKKSFLKFFEDDNTKSLISYYGKQDEIVNYIMELPECSSCDETIIKKFVNMVFDNFGTLVSSSEWFVHIANELNLMKSEESAIAVVLNEVNQRLIDTQNDIHNIENGVENVQTSIQETNAKIDDGFDTVNNGINEIKIGVQEINQTLHSQQSILNTSNEAHIELLIKDDNKEFKAKYTGNISAELFLDRDLEEPVYLSDVYVQPKLVGKSESLKDYLLNWSSENTPVLLLCGKAGIGKTSLVSELISTDVFNGNAHAVFLRKKVDCFDSSNPWESVRKAFSEYKDKPISNNEFKDKILILDGFDELCVLNNEFKGEDFLTKIPEELQNNVKILITSREYKGYFKKVETKPRRIRVEYIEWSENEMRDWCDHYSSKRNNTTVTEWCENFKNTYESLDDKRKEIFCTPIILYICCHENIDISQDKTIVEIYDKAFKNIVTKEYENVELQQETGLSAVDGAVVMWQLIKELAYQMFLNNKLDSGAGTELINNAKSRVRTLNEHISSLTDGKLSVMLKKLPAIFHFATENTDGGYEFAHKTVGEYFTAVKIYEDYFAQYNKDYYDEPNLNDKEKKEKVAELWQSFVEAFRYSRLPNDIFEYITEMKKAEYDGTSNDDDNGLNDDVLKIIYEYGIRINQWGNYAIQSPVKEYRCNSDILTKQIRNIYYNLLLFSQHRKIQLSLNYADLISANLGSADLGSADLGSADLTSANLRDADLSSAKLSSANLSSANLSSANLSSANSRYANLRYADLSCAKLNSANLRYADLSCAKLSSANLRSAKLEDANLISANLRDADLRYANLTSANLRYADLSCANLRCANLSNADLSNARYTAQTKLPKGLNPKEHGMIEVDEDGNPI